MCQEGEHSALDGPCLGLYVLIKGHDSVFGIEHLRMHQRVQRIEVLIQRLVQCPGQGYATETVMSLSSMLIPEGLIEFRGDMVHVSSAGNQYGQGLFNDTAGRLDIRISTV